MRKTLEYIALSTGYLTTSHYTCLPENTAQDLRYRLLALDIGRSIYFSEDLVFTRVPIEYGGANVRCWNINHRAQCSSVVKMMLCLDNKYSHQAWADISAGNDYCALAHLPYGSYLAVATNPIVVGKLPVDLQYSLIELELNVAWTWIELINSKDG